VGHPSAFRDPVALGVGGLAVYRLTRLLVQDEASLPLRRWAAERPEPSGPLTYFLSCPWCMSVWVAAGWAGLVAAAPAVAAPVGAALAWSAVAGLLSSLE
jgi:Protein of unknown function (DUF1360)